MSAIEAEKQLKTWIRSQHLICEGTDFIFETVDQPTSKNSSVALKPSVDACDKLQLPATGRWGHGAPSRSFAPQQQFPGPVVSHW